MDCQNLRRYLDLYIDDELELRDRIDADAHTEACAACRALVGREKAFRLALRGQLRPITAPDSLRRNLAAALEAEPTESRVVSLWRVAGPWLTPAALAAAISLVVVWPFEQRAESAGVLSASLAPSGTAAAPTPPAGPAVGVVAAPPRRGMVLASLQGMPADVAGAASDISRYMAGRVPFAVLPSLAERDGIRLVGAREVLVDGAHGAMLIYQRGAQRLSVVQTAASAADQEAPELVVTREGALSTARFVRDGVVHTVVANLDAAALTRLVENATRVE